MIFLIFLSILYLGIYLMRKVQQPQPTQPTKSTTKTPVFDFDPTPYTKNSLSEGEVLRIK